MSGQAPLARSVGGIAGQVREYVNDLRDGAPDKVAPAAASLRALAGDGSAGKVACVQNGGSEALVALVKGCDGEGSGVGDAAAAIASLCTLQSGRHLIGIAKELLMEPIVSLLATGSTAGKAQAVSALWHFAGMSEEVKAGLLASGAAAEVVTQLSKGTLDSDENTDAAVRLLQALAATQAGRQAVFGTNGSIPSLLRVVQHGTEIAAEGAAGILRLYANDGDMQRAALSQHDTVKILTAAGSHRAEAVREQAAFALRALLASAPAAAAISGGREFSSDVDLHTFQPTGVSDGMAERHNRAMTNNVPAFGEPNSELRDVLPMVELLSASTSDTEIESLLAALATMVCDHQMALLEAGAVVPLIRLLDRAGHEASILGGRANGVGIADAAGIVLSLWRWGRPDERAQLERMIVAVVDGLVKLLVTGSSIGREQAVSALCAMAATSDGVKLAIAEAGAVKPLIRLIRTSNKVDPSADHKVANDQSVSWGSSMVEEAEGVLWSLLALSRERSLDTRVSAEAAADLVQLLQTTPAMAREAAGVVRSLAANGKNRAALLQAGAADGLRLVLTTAGSRCSGDGVALAEAAGAIAMLAANDGHVGALANDTVEGLVALLERGTAAGKIEATNALWSLASISERTKLAIIDAGAVNLLIGVLGSPGTTRAHDEITAGVLWTLLSLNSKRSQGYWARYADGSGKSGESGETRGDVRVSVSAIQGLVPLLHTGSDVMREAAAGIFHLVAPSDHNKVCICKAGAVEALVDILVSVDNEAMRESAAAAIRMLPDFDDEQPVISASKQAVDALIVKLADRKSYDPRLTALLVQLCYDTCHAFLSGNSLLARAMSSRDGVEQSKDDLSKMDERGAKHFTGDMPLVDILTSGSPQLIENAREGLCWLSTASKVKLIEAGVLSALVDTCGAHAAEACFVVLKQACATVNGQGAQQCGAALARICQVHDPDGAIAGTIKQALDWVMPLLESGTAEGRTEAAGTLRCLASASEEMKVEMIRSGMFGPLVHLMSSGSKQGRQEAAGAVYEMLLLMDQCDVATNVTYDAAADVRFLLRNASPIGQMYAAGIARLCSTSPTNMEVLVASDTIEPLVALLVAVPLHRGVYAQEQAAQEAAGALLRLAAYGETKPEATSSPSAAVDEAPADDENVGGWFGGMFNVPITKVVEKAVPKQVKKSPKTEVTRLCRLLLDADSAAASDNQHAALGALLVRLVTDIYAYAPNHTATIPLALEPSGRQHASSGPGAEMCTLSATAATATAINASLESNDGSDQTLQSNSGMVQAGNTASSDAAFAPAARHGMALPEGTEHSSRDDTHALIADGNKTSAGALMPDSALLDQVRPLVELLLHGSPEIKQQAKPAIESLNVHTQVALIHAGALEPLNELLGSDVAPVLVQFCASAASHASGRHVAKVGRALAQIIVAQSGDTNELTEMFTVASVGLTQLLGTGSDQGKAEAASAMWSLSLAHEVFKSSIVEAGAIQPMVALLGTGSTQGREEAAGVLWAILASHSDPSIATVKVMITMTDAMNVVSILTEGGELGQEAAAGIISLVAASDRNKTCLFYAQCVEPLVALLYSEMEGVRTQASSALRSMCVYEPEVYASSIRADLIQGSSEVRNMVRIQLTPSKAGPHIAALIEQMVYDLYDVMCRASAVEVDEPKEEPGHTLAGTAAAASALSAAANVSFASRDLSPAHRVNNVRRAAVLREMLEHASDEQNASIRLAFLSLSVLTKQQLIDSGGLHLLVALLGADIARSLVVSIASLCRTDDGSRCVDYCSALAGLASPQERSVNNMIVRVVPHVVHLLNNGTDAGKEEAAGGLRALSVTSFNAKVAIAEAGAFAPLVKLLGEGTQTAREDAAGALWRLLTMMTESNIAISISVKKAGDLVALLHASSDAGKLAACGCIRLASATTDENRCAIVRARVVEPMVALLASSNDDIREEAGWALRALAYPGTEIVDETVRIRMTRASQGVDSLVAVLGDRIHANDQLSALLEYLQYDIFDVRAKTKHDHNSSDGAELHTAVVSTELESSGASLVEQSREHDRIAGSPSVAQALAKLRNRGRQLGGSREAASGLTPIVQLVQAGSERTHTYARSALSSLSMETKAAIIESGALHQLVAVIGGHASKAIIHMLTRVAASADGAGSGAGTSAADLAEELVLAFSTISVADERMGRFATGATAVVPALVRLLESGSPTGQEQAAGALRHLSGMHDNLTVAIAKEGAFEPLVKLLGTGTIVAREEAAGALWRVLGLMVRNNIDVTLSPARATDLVSMLKQSSAFGKERAAGVLALCATSDINRAAIMHAHAVEPLVNLLVHSTQAVGEAVAAALVNLAITDGDVDCAYRGWLDSAASEVARLVSFMKHGGCSSEEEKMYSNPSPSTGNGNGNGNGMDVADLSIEDSANLRGGVKAVTSISDPTPSVALNNPGDVDVANSQLGAVVEQLVYDCFYMRYASGLLSKFCFMQRADSAVLHPREVYARVVDERQLAYVRRLVLRLLYSGDAEAQGHARACIFAFSVATKVAFIDDGALRPLAELLGANFCDTAIAYLAQAHERTDGENVAEVAAHLRVIASDAGGEDVSSRVSAGISGVVSLLETGVAPGGKEAAINALWSLSMIGAEVKAEIVRAGALSATVEMLYGGRPQFRSDVTGLLWSLAMNEENAEPIVDAGVCPGLVQMLHVGDEAGQEAAAGCLRLCATFDSNKPFIMSARAVEPLVNMLNLWSEAICEQAAGALLALSRYSGGTEHLARAADEVQALVDLRLVQARLERTVSLPTDSGKQHLSALLERLVLDIYDEQSALNPLIQGVTKRFGATSVKVSILYGGGGAPAGASPLASESDAQPAVSKLSLHSSEEQDTEAFATSIDPTDKDRGFPYIVMLLTQCSSDAREHASGAIRALSVSTQAALVEAGCLPEMCAMLGPAMSPVLIRILTDSSHVSSIDITAYTCELAKFAALDVGVATEAEAVVTQLVNILESGATPTEREQAATGLRHLAAASATLRYAIVREGGFGPLTKLLGSGTGAGKEEAASVLWQLVSLMNESGVAVTLSTGSASDLVGLACGVGGVSLRGRQAACSVMEQCCADRSLQTNRRTLVGAGAIEAACAVIGSADLPSDARQQGVRALLGLAGPHESLAADAWLMAATHQISSIGWMMAEGRVERERGAESLRHCEAMVEQLAYDVCSVLRTVAGGSLPGVVQQTTVMTPAGVAGAGAGSDARMPPTNTVDVEGTQLPPGTNLALVDCERVDIDVNSERAQQRIDLLAACLQSPTDLETRAELRGAFAALSTPTKEALIAGGAIHMLAPLIGSAVGEGVCEAVLRQIARAAATTNGGSCAELAGVVHALAAADPSVEGRTRAAVGALVPLISKGSMHGREQGVSALWTLSTIGEPLKFAIAGADAMEPLVHLAKGGSPAAKESAAGCLWALTVSNAALKRAAHDAGAVEPLVQLLFSGTQAAKEEACGALWSIAMVPEITLVVIGGGAAPGCMQLLYTGSEVGQESAAGLLNVCASQDDNKPAIIAANVIEPLVALCQTGSDAAKGQAAGALAALVTFEVPVPRQLVQSVTEVERLTTILASASGKQQVLAVSTEPAPEADGFGVRAASGLGMSHAAASKHPLAHVLERLVYDVHDMFTASALGGEAGFGLARGGARGGSNKWYVAPGLEHDVRGLVEIVNDGAEALLKAAEGGMHCFSVDTKVAIIQSGGLAGLVHVLGAGAARAIVHCLSTAPSTPDGPRVSELMAHLCRIGSADGRVATMALDTAPALLQLLQTGASGTEQAAGALWNLRMLNATVDRQLMAAGAVEVLVKTLGLGTAASHATPTSLARLWHLLCLPDDHSDFVGEESATDVVQLLYTGTDVGKEAAARCVRLCGVDDDNRSSFMRARCVEPLVEGLQMAPMLAKQEMSGALLALGERGASSPAVDEPTVVTSWYGSFFGTTTSAATGNHHNGGASADPESTQDEAEIQAIRKAEGEIRELISLLFDVDANFGGSFPGGNAGGAAASLSGGFQKQRKAAARLEQLMYYVFHAKSCFIVM